jgi:Multicopper oxidase
MSGVGETAASQAARDESYAAGLMFHCHLLQHEDNGLKGQLVVVQPGQPPTGSSQQQHHDRRQDAADASLDRGPTGSRIMIERKREAR